MKPITIDQATNKAFEHYRDILKKTGNLSAINHSDDEWVKLSKHQQYEHLLWMCDYMLSPFTSHFSIDKRSRWLGFIQGIMISNGLTTIQNERDITRPWFTNGK